MQQHCRLWEQQLFRVLIALRGMLSLACAGSPPIVHEGVA